MMPLPPPPQPLPPPLRRVAWHGVCRLSVYSQGVCNQFQAKACLGKVRKALSASASGAPGASGSAARAGTCSVASANSRLMRPVATAAAVPTICLPSGAKAES